MASISTEEDVVNLALSHIGAKAISDLDNDSTPEAVESRRLYYNIRDKMMRQHAWNFLTLRVALSDSGTDPVFGWDEGYLLPSNFLRLITVHATKDNTDQPPFRLEKQSLTGTLTNVLLINSSTCWIRYIYKEVDPSKWITDFQDAVAWQLAAELALVLPVSGAGFERLEKKAQSALLYAKSLDGLDDYPERVPDGSWVTDRIGNDDGGW